MFNSRKGVSEVVANVLIVLLVIVGIAVIWSVVKPTIDKSAEQVNADCFTVSVEPVSCIYNSVTSSYTVSVKRNPGSGGFENIELLFNQGSNSGISPSGLASSGPSPLTELSSRSVTTTLPPGLTNGLAGTTVNTVVRSGGQLCQVTTQPVNCA
ncbi:MAG: hypothetical protein AABX10_04325 [Nanoarchaeota archaeon]